MVPLSSPVHSAQRQDENRFSNLKHALTWYLRTRPMMDAVPSLDGVNLTRTAHLDEWGDAQGYVLVPTPRVDGGAGSANEDRLCQLVDIERTLPPTREGTLILLVGTLYPERKAIELLREHPLTREQKWTRRTLGAEVELLERTTAQRMRRKGLIP